MKILILGLNYAPEPVGIAVYTTGMAEFLAAEGHEVRVIAGQPYYPAWKIMEGHRVWTFSKRSENGVEVKRMPHYIPSRPTGGRRLLHHASFALSSFLPTLWAGLAWRPDVVITVAPSLIATPNAWLAALMGGARSWLHVQDFEVEASFATGLIAKGGMAARLALRLERWVLSLFDTVSSISPQMCRKLSEKGVAAERIVEFRNWADIDAIRPMSEPSPYLEEWGITTAHVALYSGNIANKQGIEIVVEAARLLKERDDLTFVICGEGPNRANLERLAARLPNIQFHDLQPKERLNELLGLATIHLLPQKADAADLVLPSKLANMLASGRPVVATAAMGTGLAMEVEGCGVVVEPGDASKLAVGIAGLLNATDEGRHSTTSSRSRAEKRWARTRILADLTGNISQGALMRRAPNHR